MCEGGGAGGGGNDAWTASGVPIGGTPVGGGAYPAGWGQGYQAPDLGIPLVPTQPGGFTPTTPLEAAEQVSQFGSTQGLVPDMDPGDSFDPGTATPPRNYGVGKFLLGGLGATLLGVPGAAGGATLGDMLENLFAGKGFRQSAIDTAKGIPSTGVGAMTAGAGPIISNVMGIGAGKGMQGIVENTARGGRDQSNIKESPEGADMMGFGYMPSSPVPEQAALTQPVPLAQNIPSARPVEPQTVAVPQKAPNVNKYLADRGIRGKGTKAPDPGWFSRGY